MTLIVASRFIKEESTIYLYDVRVTHNGNSSPVQGDSILKWQFLDERTGFVVAGPVDFWRQASKAIEKCLNEIHIYNILEADGPFHEAVNRAAWSFDSPTGKAEKIGALGFMIDEESNRNIQFAIEGFTGQGVPVL